MSPHHCCFKPVFKQKDSGPCSLQDITGNLVGQDVVRLTGMTGKGSLTGTL